MLTTGVVCGPPIQSASAAESFIRENWNADFLRLTSTRSARPFQNNGRSPYGRTISATDAVLQRSDIVGIAKSTMTHLEGALKTLRDDVVATVARTAGAAYQLSHAHILRQHPESAASSSFSFHRDDEDDSRIRLTFIVKLTACASSMKVFAARDVFQYGYESGSWAMFNSKAFHSSMPQSDECVKVAFFFV